MLERHDIAWLRLEFAADLATPRAVFEGLSQPRYLLDGRDVLPSLIVALTVPVRLACLNGSAREKCKTTKRGAGRNG